MQTILISLLLLASPAPRVAILDFQNLTRDHSLDNLSIGIADTLTTYLFKSPAFRLVERSRLADVLQEIRFDHTKFVDPVTAQNVGRMAGADTILTGSFQKSGDRLLITARFIDVETANVRATAMVEGLTKDIFALQAALAAKLIGAALAPAPRVIPMAAFKSFSDGLYYLRQDLPNDAIANFDHALRLVPNYTEAQFYKGLALEKRERWDEAIALFKKALPGAAAERQTAWTWKAPSPGGLILGIDTNELSLQRDAFIGEGILRRQKRVIYGERNGSNTVLHIADPVRQTVRRVELPDDKVILTGGTMATDRLTIIRSAGRWYGIGADGSVRWHMDLPAETPFIGTASDSIYAFFPSQHRLAAFNDRTLKLRWERQDLTVDRLERLKARKTPANGEVWIAKTDAGIRAIRVVDGKDAWVFETPGPGFSHIVTDRLAIVFEWERGVSFVDLETGKRVFDLPVPQFADAVNAGQVGAPSIVSAAVLGNTLYFLSRTRELYAVRLGQSSASLLWHTAVDRRIDSMREAGGHLFAASSETGEVLMLDAATGAIAAPLRMGQGVSIYDASPEIVVAADSTLLAGLDPITGAKRWEFPAAFPEKDAAIVNGVVSVRNSATQVSGLDAETGELLWQYSGAQPPGIVVTDKSFVMVEPNGMKEYAARKRAPGIRDIEVLAELANALAAKGNVREASAFLDKARELDPDYPPVRLLRSRLLHDGQELATYAGLVGLDSQAGRQAVAELKRNYGIMWYESGVPYRAGKPQLVGGKLLTAGRTTAISGQREVLLMKPDSGAVLWRQPSERFSGAVGDGASGRIWHVTGDDADQKAVVLYELSIETGEPKELARSSRTLPVTSASVSFVRGQIYVLTVSPDLASKNQLIVVDRFTPDGAPLSNESFRVPEGTFLQDANVPRPPIRVVDGRALLWPASSVLVDDGAIYAFTPDGAVYKQK